MSSPLDSLVDLVDDENGGTRLSGPLTQGLQFLRAEASRPLPPPPTPPSLPPPPLPTSPLLFTQVEDGEESFLFRTATEETLAPWVSEEVEVQDSTIDESLEIEEVSATPVGSPSTHSFPIRPNVPPPHPLRLQSVVTHPPQPPLRNTPIYLRLRQPLATQLI